MNDVVAKRAQSLRKSQIPADPVILIDGNLAVKFPASFASDVDPKTAVFMADSQVPWASTPSAARSEIRLEVQA